MNSLSKLGFYDPRKNTISNAIRKTSEISRLPQNSKKSLPRHLRVNRLDGYGQKWTA
jgi:hypothetical protein